MNWKNTLVAGAGTGAMLATLVALIMLKIGIEPPSFGAAIAIFIGMIITSAYTVKKTSQSIGCCDPSLKQLIPISFLTFFIPILGAAFGAPNSDLDTLTILILLGTIGGVFWSIPFAIWNFLKNRNQSEDKPTPIILSAEE